MKDSTQRLVGNLVLLAALAIAVGGAIAYFTVGLPTEVLYSAAAMMLILFGLGGSLVRVEEPDEEIDPVDAKTE